MAVSRVEVLQHEYGIAKGEGALVTRGIWICTGWYGWDSDNKVGFLCHLDSPFSALSTGRILYELRSKVSADHYFETYLIGGKCYFWSPITRWVVKRIVRKQSALTIEVKDLPYDNCPLSHRCISIATDTGQVDDKTVPGPSTPKGFFWFFKSVKKARGSE